MTQDEFIKKYGRNREAKMKDFGIDIHNYLLEMIDRTGSESPYPYDTMYVSDVISTNKNWFHWGEFYFHSKCDLSYIEELREIHEEMKNKSVYITTNGTVANKPPDEWYVLSHSFKNTHNYIVVCKFCAEHFFEKAI